MALPRAWLEGSRAARWGGALLAKGGSWIRSWWQGGRIERWERECRADMRHRPLATGGIIVIAALLTDLVWRIVLQREIGRFGIGWRILVLLWLGLITANRRHARAMLGASIVLRWLRRS